MAYFDWRTKPLWKGLNEDQQLALMGMMERNPKDKDGAYGVMSSVVNRAKSENKAIGDLLGEKKSQWGTYQPLSEADQYERAQGYLNDPEFQSLTSWAADRRRGFNDDPTKGATHYLAPEQTMLGLEAEEPGKYKSWRKWTGYAPGKGYANVSYRDKSHAFVTPHGPVHGGSMHPNDWSGGISPQEHLKKLQQMQQEGAGYAAGYDALNIPDQEIPGVSSQAPAADNPSAPDDPYAGGRNTEAYDQLLASLMAKAYPEPKQQEFGWEQFSNALVPAGAAIYEAASRPGASTWGSIGAGGVGFGTAVKGYGDKEKERALSEAEKAAKLQGDLLKMLQEDNQKDQDWQINARKYAADQEAKRRDDERADKQLQISQGRLDWDKSKQPRKKTMTPRDLSGMMTNRVTGEVDPNLIDQLIFYGGETYAQDPGGKVILENRYAELNRKYTEDPNSLSESEFAVFNKLRGLIEGSSGGEAMVP